MPARSSLSYFWPTVWLATLCTFAVWRSCNPSDACQCAAMEHRGHD